MGETTDGFDDRKKAFEAKYLHDEELNFRINARRNYLFGLWAAEVLGYRGEQAKSYVEEVIVFELQKTHNQSILDKVSRDLKAAKIQMSEHRMQKELEKCWEMAHQMIMGKAEI